MIIMYCIIIVFYGLFFYFHKQDADEDPDNLTDTADDAHEDTEGGREANNQHDKCAPTVR